MCQHCENAPCETVCPVNATIHSEAGLNVMVYNRCIGTRYCANNCPFKVRRFNYFDYNQRPSARKDRRFLGLPGISRTANGKRRARHDQAAEKSERNGADARRDGEVHLLRAANRGSEDRGACARRRFRQDDDSARFIYQRLRAGLPDRAIVFGDISDPETRVSKIKTENRNYRLLEYLNVKTRTSYLARIRNPNPKMPDAGAIAVASLEHEPEGGEVHGGHPANVNREPAAKPEAKP